MADRGGGTRKDPDETALNDQHLLRAYAQDGDHQAFATLARRHRAMLWASALRVLRDYHDAEDALQNALLSAARRASTYEGRGAVGAWLRMIVVNESLELGARLRRQPVSIDFADADAAGVLPAPDNDPTATRAVAAEDLDALSRDLGASASGLEARPGAAAAAGAGDLDDQLQVRLRRALMEMPRAFSRVIVQSALMGASNAEIAAAEDIPLATVRSRLWRARALLKDAAREVVGHPRERLGSPGESDSSTG